MTNLITLTDLHSPATEAYQSLRTNIEFAALEKPLRSLLVTGVDQHIDKSTAIANLAIVMAQAGDRVLLVDGDLRRPRQHELFGVANTQGITTWFEAGGEPPLQATKVERLQLLTAGPQTTNPVALLSQKRLEQALAELQSHADYILCDAPPVLAVTDAALWAGKVDGVLLLVNAGSTKRDNAIRARAILEKVHARILGAVLLNVEKDVALSGW